MSRYSTLRTPRHAQLLRRLLARHSAEFALVIFAAAAAGICSLAPFMAVYYLSVGLLDATASPAPGWIIALCLGGMLARMAALGAGVMLSHRTAYSMLHELRIELARKLTKVPLSFVLSSRAGNLAKVAGEDIDRLESFFGHHLIDITLAIVAPLTALALLAAIDWRIALAAGLVLPPGILLQIQMFSRERQEAAVHSRTLGDIASAAAEYIQSLPVAKIFGLSASAFRALRETIEQRHALIVRTARQVVPLWCGFEVLAGANVVLVLPVGWWLHRRGTIDLAEWVLAIFLSYGLTQCFVRLTHFGSQFSQVREGAQRVAEILDQRELPIIPANAVRVGHDIEFQNVGLRYAGVPALQQVSFTIRTGSTTALVGPSGAGKSSVAHVAARFNDPQTGRVLIGGRDLRSFGAEELSALVSFVFQDSVLFSASVEDNIRLFDPTIDRDAVVAAAKAAHLHESILALPGGYDAAIEHIGPRLSGGERQRLSLARALVRNTPIVVIDEVTASADPITEALLLDSLRRMCKGRTVLMISHRMATALAADHVLVFREGRLEVADSPRMALQRSSTFRELVMAEYSDYRPHARATPAALA